MAITTRYHLPWHSACSVLAVLLAVACYWNSLSGDLVHDDIFAIKENQDLRSDTPLTKIFLDDFWGEAMSSVVSHKSYRPLTVLSFRLNYLLHGLDPWGYHLLNLFLHCLATLLFGWLCKREVFPSGGEGQDRCTVIAMLLFSTHPVHTEAVSGVVGRADVLASIFFLFSLLFYCSSTRTNSWPHMLVKLLLSIACGGAAMLCKEHGATVLGVCLAYDVLIANRDTILRWYRRDVATPSLLPLLLRGSMLLLATAVLLALRISLLHGHLPHFSAQDNPASFAESFITRALTYTYLIFFNFRLLFHPCTLSYDWQMDSIPLVQSLADPRNLLTAATFVTLAGLTWTALAPRRNSHAPQHRTSHAPQHRTSHAPLWGMLLVVVPFLPASNLLIRVGFVVAERILYIPSFGWCILVATGVHCLYQHWPLLRCPLASLTLFLLVVFAGRTVSRNAVWHSRETLFSSALVTVPGNAKVHFNYANFLKDSGRGQEAIRFYRRAIELSPTHAISHNNLGSLLSGQEAEFHFRQAVHHNPQHFKAFYNLGRNLEEQDRLAEAEKAYEQSLAIRSTYVDSLMSLAALLTREEVSTDTSPRAEEGWQLMQRALQEAPLNPDVHNNAGALLSRIGRVEEAVSMYESALKLHPRHVHALTALGRLYRSLRHNTKAEELLRQSLSLNPDPSTYFSLASLLHNSQRLEEAEFAFRQGLTLEPRRTDLVCGLMQTLLQANRLEEVQGLLDTALQTHPSSACVQQVAGTLLLQQKQPNQALNYLERALLLSESKELSADVHHLRGGAFKDLGQLEEAEEAYRAALSLAPHRPATQMNLGALLHLKKEYESARVEYEAALKMDPNNSLIRSNLQKLERAAAKSGWSSQNMNYTS